MQDKPIFKQVRARKNVETIDSVSAWMKGAIPSDFVRFSRAIVVAGRQQTAELSALYAIAACAGPIRSLEYVPVGIGGLGMQRIALVAATALVAAFAQGAHAADMAVSPFFRSSPVVIGYNWQGYYVGANVGWSRASSNISWSPGGAFVDAGPIASAAKNTLSSNGATGGIQTGYNWQWGNVVAGIEGDVAFLRNNVNLTTSPIPGALPTTALSESARLDWLITVRPRIGYAWDNWLFYVTGGWALGKAVWSDGLTASNGVIIGNTMSRELGGWTVGAGVEYGLVSGWSLKAEYLYTNLGSAAVLMGPVPGVPGDTTVGTNHTMTDQIARIGFNFRFGGEHETVVKYPN